jgi:hypothetical protein
MEQWNNSPRSWISGSAACTFEFIARVASNTQVLPYRLPSRCFWDNVINHVPGTCDSSKAMTIRAPAAAFSENAPA